MPEFIVRYEVFALKACVGEYIENTAHQSFLLSELSKKTSAIAAVIFY